MLHGGIRSGIIEERESSLIGGSVDKKYLHQISVRNNQHMSKLSPGNLAHTTLMSMENRFIDVHSYILTLG
jgi:hypothetical protein